jgi:hypothetical protein
MDTTRTGARAIDVHACVAALALACSAIATLPRIVAAQPEMPGPYEVAEWNAGAVQPGTTVVVYYPKNAPVAGPPVVVQHGGGEGIGMPHKLKSERLASRGFVAITPIFADLLLAPSAAHGMTVNAILDWAAAESGKPGSMLEGKVDGAKRGVMGHSYGGWTVFFATQQSMAIKAIVAYDAVGDLTLASNFAGPSIHLLASQGNCGGGSNAGYLAAPPPKLLATVANSNHCDVGNAGTLCPVACGGVWSDLASTTFLRYGVAFITCVLGGHGSEQMGDYLGGAMWQADAALTGKQQEGTITCAPSMFGDPTPGGMAGMGAAGMGAAGTGPSAGMTGGSGAAGSSGGIGGSAAPGGVPVEPGTDTGTGGASAGAGTGGAAGTAPTAGAQAASASQDAGGCASIPWSRASEPRTLAPLALAALVLAWRRRQVRSRAC